MKKLLFVILLMAVSSPFFISCSSGKHTTNRSDSGQARADSLQDGSCFEKAIVIKEKSEGPGVQAEYKWIRVNYPGSTNKMQGLNHQNGKSYDILTIVTAGGQEKKIYFDITRFFGKW